MKNKLLLVLNILVILFCGTMLVLHFTGVLELTIKTFTKAGILLVTYVLGVFNYLAKSGESLPKTSYYAELYQHIIRDAFANDKTGHRNL